MQIKTENTISIPMEMLITEKNHIMHGRKDLYYNDKNKVTMTASLCDHICSVVFCVAWNIRLKKIEVFWSTDVLYNSVGARARVYVLWLVYLNWC